MKVFLFLKTYMTTKHMQKRFRTRQELEVWQDQKVKQFLAKILPLSPFYRSTFSTYQMKDWGNFPTIDKKCMMENFDLLNTVGIKKEEAFALALEAEESRDFSPKIGEVSIGLSSGTSGNRGIFLVSPDEQIKWAATILAKALPGSLFMRHKIAFFLRANSNLYTTISGKRIQFEFFDMLRPFEEHISRLNQYQPTIVVGPPSMLRLLSDSLKERTLRITPKKILSVAEVLDPLDEMYISSCFRLPVDQIYQCTEGFLGVTCSVGTLHLNEDVLVIQKEYLDKEKRKFCPIITDFSRTTQPIIRYRLNDILAEKETPCECGSVFTAIECVEGRSDDLFYLPGVEGNGLVPIFPDFIRRAIITASEDIDEYLVIQHNVNQLEICLRSKAPMDILQKIVTDHLSSFIRHSNCLVPEIKFSPYNLKLSEKKLRRIERRFDPL